MLYILYFIVDIYIYIEYVVCLYIYIDLHIYILDNSLVIALR